MSAYNHSGLVYFIACAQYVKIGYTASTIEKRLAGIVPSSRIICPDDIDWTRGLDVLHTVPGCVMRDERRFHNLFASHHVVGEWLRLDPAFIVRLSRIEFVTYKQNLLDFRRARAELKRRPSLAVAA